jgi:hypothetical protein
MLRKKKLECAENCSVDRRASPKVATANTDDEYKIGYLSRNCIIDLRERET